MDQWQSKAAAVFIALIVIYNVVLFTKRRRCPHCKRWFAGKKLKSVLTNSSTSTGSHWDYHSSSFQRETRTRGTVNVSLQCKRCGYRWSYDETFSRTRKH